MASVCGAALGRQATSACRSSVVAHYMSLAADMVVIRGLGCRVLTDVRCAEYSLQFNPKSLSQEYNRPKLRALVCKQTCCIGSQFGWHLDSHNGITCAMTSFFSLSVSVIHVIRS